MKLATFERNGERHIGALRPDGITLCDFTASRPASSHFRDMLALIDGGPVALDQARELTRQVADEVRVADVRLLAPVPEPRQMRDFLCFEQHIRQARSNRYLFGQGEKLDPATIELPQVWYDQPIYYKCNRFSVIGTGQDVLWPRYCEKLDYELEFGAILGTGGKNIQQAEARAHIFGYCIFNDISARDAQMKEMPGQLGPAKGKDFDTGNVMGPWLVTADEIPDPYNLTMIARVNGEEWSRGNSSTMGHKFEDILAHVSNEETLHAGEFFGSGTVGNGCGLELGRFLKPDDVVELEIDRLGVLRNRIVRKN
jgi:2-keto-4-pentenoate hydratase/2-oxohepta-3-ene-1,7-dioic acid hydratase in catechol pathway